MHQSKKIAIGILANHKIDFQLNGIFHDITNNDLSFGSGNYSISIKGNQFFIEGSTINYTEISTFTLEPTSPDATFVIKKVTIGINFHWEQKEDQIFGGSLQFKKEENLVWAINILDIEAYLQSVISSEMSANASLEFLKAHAVISRSWVLTQIQKKGKTPKHVRKAKISNANEIEKWYDHEDHQLFDVCADDHCQRYHGKTKIISDKALQAVIETKDEILLFNGEICDTRFSKCCGGLSENFENVWEPVYHPYLSKIVDSDVNDSKCVDLRIEEEADLWIRNKPHAYCNTKDKKIISQVLPDFDQKTTDFYRWEVTYTQNELAALLKKKSNIDFGEIIKLEVLKRGHSSRISKLKIVGTKNSLTVGKELEIRKWLSETHLYSSAFVIDHKNIKNGIPQKFYLKGAGWGHGVGLCQIGAAVMGEKGFSYQEILSHYFRGAELKKI